VWLLAKSRRADVGKQFYEELGMEYDVVRNAGRHLFLVGEQIKILKAKRKALKKERRRKSSGTDSGSGTGETNGEDDGAGGYTFVFNEEDNNGSSGENGNESKSLDLSSLTRSFDACITSWKVSQLPDDVRSSLRDKQRRRGKHNSAARKRSRSRSSSRGDTETDETRNDIGDDVEVDGEDDAEST